MKLHYGFDNISKIDWSSILPIIIPFLLVGFLLILVALVDLYRHRTTRENVLIWTIVIVFFNTIGPILYFVIGRKDVNKHATRNQ
ncbi:PLD nuclease N-terminal domain-containing protein [Lysinibacillus sp. NPDC097287]|uniref:PLD nuclease N-terminal domain-containing protein n=1 Tax=Lysinibacillus sp. NPDC097287 TaxID=3364144 RepID=UPI003825023B